MITLILISILLFDTSARKQHQQNFQYQKLPICYTYLSTLFNYLS